ALQLRTVLGDPYGIASSRNNLGTVASEIADWPAARDHYLQAIAGFRAAGDLGKIALVQGNLGLLLCRQGELSAARPHLLAALQIQRRLKNQFGIGSALAMLGQVEIEAGHPDEALALLQNALAEFAFTGAAEQQAEIHLLIGRAHLERDDLAEAEDWLHKALALAARNGEKAHEGMTLRWLARLCKARGELPAANDYLVRAIALLEDSGSRRELALARADAE
ncbi:MAG: tetratricopeptide repeat protein, partial [Cyanobacteria bacterium REEB65]|nr:tetratricopeptide repeat protein [Cyanobacteria bacterium REEB65]